MLLYDAARPNPRAVRMTLLEKRITVPSHDVDVDGGENSRSDFLARNPGGQVERLLPLDLLEFAGAALARPQQWLGQARGGVVLHDPGRASGADHAVVHRMIGIALDIADASVSQMDADAAAASPYAGGGRFHHIVHRRGRIDPLHWAGGPAHSRRRCAVHAIGSAPRTFIEMASGTGQVLPRGMAAMTCSTVTAGGIFFWPLGTRESEFARCRPPCRTGSARSPHV